MTIVVSHGRLRSEYRIVGPPRIGGYRFAFENIKQIDDHSCGFVAALTLARYYSLTVSDRDVLKLVRPKRSAGVDRRQMQAALRQLGIYADFWRGLTYMGLKRLLELGWPVMLTVHPEGWASDHWTLIRAIEPRQIYLTNYRRLTRRQFEKEWFDPGEGLVCQRM